MSYATIPVCAANDAPLEHVRWAHECLQEIPERVNDILWEGRVYVYVRAKFSDDWEQYEWHGRKGELFPWSEMMGYWSTTDAYAHLNAAPITSKATLASVLFHELGHAICDVCIPGAERTPEFRAAWSAGRKRVQERFPAQYDRREGLGMYCLHWTRGVKEAYADAVAWVLQGRACIHPEFGRTFRECVEIVEADLS